MGSPSTSLSTLRPDLADSFMEFDLEMNQRQFIGRQVLPVIETQSASGDFGLIPVEQLLADSNVDRASKSGYNRGDWQFTKNSFTTTERGHEETIDDNLLKVYANYFDAEMISTMRAYNAVLQAAEKRTADLVFNATTWTGATLTTGITHEWDDPTNAVPVTNVEAAVQKVYSNTGIWPDTLIINRKVFRNLRLCDQIIAMCKYQGFQDVRPGNVTTSHLSAIFDLPKIIVAGGSRNSASEGQSASMGQIWSDEYAMVCKTASTNDIQEPCLGRTFHWSEDGSMPNGIVETYRDETVRGDVVRVRHQLQEKILYTELGHLISNVTTI